MNWFFGATETSDAPHSREVQTLLERINTASLIEDKQEAVQKLSEISSHEDYQKDFGVEAIKTIFEVLQKEHGDEVMVKQLLFTLLNLTKQKSIITLLLKKEYIRIIVTLLEVNNDYAKYHTVQILTHLLKDDVDLVQQGIIAQPIGVSKLVELLGHSEEIIRNECLLLMHALTFGGNQEVQKIIAFEGAFEKLFSIIIEEGGVKGGIIVQDCLNIIKNLLFDNKSNQKYFREIGCYESLKIMFTCPPGEITIKISNIIIRSLEILYFLMSGEEASSQKDFAVKTGILNQVIYLALSDKYTKELIFPSFTNLECMLYHHKASQEYFLGYNFVEGDDFVSAVVTLCKIVLYDLDETKQQKAWLVLKSYLDSNTEGQLFISSTIKSPIMISSTAEEGMLCGITIASALFSGNKPRKNILESFYASRVLTTILRSNNKCKEILLEIPYEIKTGSPSVPFFACLVKIIISTLKSKNFEGMIAVGYLNLLAQWISNSAESCSRFLENPHDFLHLVEVVNSNPEYPLATEIVGLSTLVVGLLGVGFVDSSQPGKYSRETLLDAIKTRIGEQKMMDKMSVLTKSNLFVSAEKDKSYKLKDVFDVESVDFIHAAKKQVDEFLATLDQIVVKVKKQEETVKNQQEEEKKRYEQNQELIVQLKKENEDIKRQAHLDQKSLQEKINKLTTSNQEVELALKESVEKVSSLDKSLKDQSKEFSTRQDELDQHIKTLNKQLEQQEDELRTSVMLQNQYEEALKEKQVQLAQMSTKSQFEELYNNSQEEILKLKQTLEAVKVDLLEKDNLNAKTNQLLLDVKAELKEKSSIIDQSKLQISTLQEDLLTKIDELEQKHKQEMEMAVSQNQTMVEKKEDGMEQQIISQMQVDLAVEKQARSELEVKIKNLETEMAKKSAQCKDLEHDNEDMMDIIEKLEDKLKKLNSE